MILELLIAAKLGFAKHALVGLPAVAKDLLKLGANDERVHELPQDAQRHFIVNYVAHQDASLHGGKKVFVVPNGVGADALLVHKILTFTNVRNLGDPTHRNSEEGRNGVLYK